MRMPRPVAKAMMGTLSRAALNTKVPIKAQRRIIDATARTLPLPAGTVVRPMTLGGQRAERITVGATERDTAILYLHGGAFIAGSIDGYRSLAAYLARSSGAAVYTLDWRLAPEHPFPAGLEDAVAAFGEIPLEPARIAVSGDSAGGCLAVAATRRLVDAGTTPGALAVISPCLDPVGELTGRQRDLVVSAAWGRMGGRAYLGSGDPDAAGFAPGRGSLAGLPPTLVHAVPDEVLYPQIIRFVSDAMAAGVDVRLVDLPGLWHSCHIQAGTVRDAGEALRDLGVWTATRLALPSRVT